MLRRHLLQGSAAVMTAAALPLPALAGKAYDGVVLNGIMGAGRLLDDGSFWDELVAVELTPEQINEVLLYREVRDLTVQDTYAGGPNDRKRQQALSDRDVIDYLFEHNLVVEIPPDASEQPHLRHVRGYLKA